MSIVRSWIDSDPRVRTVEFLLRSEHKRSDRDTDGISLQEALVKILDQESKCASSPLNSEFFTDLKEVFEMRPSGVVDL